MKLKMNIKNSVFFILSLSFEYSIKINKHENKLNNVCLSSEFSMIFLMNSMFFKRISNNFSLFFANSAKILKIKEEAKLKFSLLLLLLLLLMIFSKMKIKTSLSKIWYLNFW